jgi:3-dehydroquinate dehydratase
MRVTVQILEGDVFALSLNLPDTVDTSGWQANDWAALAEAINAARYQQPEALAVIIGPDAVTAPSIAWEDSTHVVLSVEADGKTKFSELL